MKYIQCPHCNAFMSVYGLTESIATWSCQNEKCGKKFKARVVKILTEYIEVTREIELK